MVARRRRERGEGDILDFRFVVTPMVSVDPHSLETPEKLGALQVRRTSRQAVEGPGIRL